MKSFFLYLKYFPILFYFYDFYLVLSLSSNNSIHNLKFVRLKHQTRGTCNVVGKTFDSRTHFWYMQFQIIMGYDYVLLATGALNIRQTASVFIFEESQNIGCAKIRLKIIFFYA